MRSNAVGGRLLNSSLAWDVAVMMPLPAHLHEAHDTEGQSFPLAACISQLIVMKLMMLKVSLPYSSLHIPSHLHEAHDAEGQSFLTAACISQLIFMKLMMLKVSLSPQQPAYLSSSS